MYPIQGYSNQTQSCNPYLQPQVNAVKIDIINPQAYGGTNSQGQVNPIAPANVQQAPYQYNSMYNMPQVQQYNTPGAYPIPPIMPASNIQQNVTAVQPVSTPIQAPIVQPTIAQPTVVKPVIVPPTPVVPAPVIIPTPIVAQPPVVPAPVVSAPVNQQVNVNPSIPAAIVDKKENTTVAPVAPVQAQNPAETDNTIANITAALASNDVDTQTAAIQKMAEIAQTDPSAAKALLNEQTFGQLVNVINADTSKLQGPNGKSDPKNLSPLEKAEINKQFAVYTLAILQKNFRDEINKEMKKNNLPDIAINDLPYIKEGIVNNLKDNPNPTIREACLSALNYVGRPEDKEVLKTLYGISAKHDSNPAVRVAAKDYLSKLPA